MPSSTASGGVSALTGVGCLSPGSTIFRAASTSSWRRSTASAASCGLTAPGRSSRGSMPPRPGMLCDIRHALIWQHDGVRTVLSPTGETWIDLGAERVGINLDPGLIPFLKGGKWGLADTAGEVIAEPQFDDPVFFTPAFRGIAWAKRGNHWCAMDRRAHPIPDIPCADVNPAGSSFRFACKVEP